MRSNRALLLAARLLWCAPPGARLWNCTAAQRQFVRATLRVPNQRLHRTTAVPPTEAPRLPVNSAPLGGMAYNRHLCRRQRNHER
jgi:hypothetical protein